ncbi:MAG TPA: hypothetical protein VFA32_20230, partial [Dehalococcoidia bacterium]|nr:hypothetical protein [Dehalococcoidia bacterium]
TLTVKWLRIHRRSALGLPTGPDPVRPGAGNIVPEDGLLEVEARESAEKSGRLDLRNAVTGLTGKEVPPWLQRPPGMSQIDSPMDWATARLVERYRLPWRIWDFLQNYILTLDKYWLGRLDFASALLATADPGPLPYQGYSVTIWGLDEFVTKEDWELIWEKCVSIRQEELWEQRGMKPQGHRTKDLERLKRGLPLYRDRVEKEWSGKKWSKEQALSEFTRSGELSGASMDESIASDLLDDLKIVLAPQEED